MSGRKYSEVELMEERRLALEGAEKAAASVDLCSEMVCELERVVEMSGEDPDLFRSFLVELSATLENIRLQSGEINEVASLENISFEAAQGISKDAEAIENKVNLLRSRGDDMRAGLGVRADLVAAQSRILQRAEKTRYWYPEETRSIEGKINEIYATVEKHLRSNENADTIIQDQVVLNECCNTMERLSGRMRSCELKEARRQLTVKAILDVCAQTMNYPVEVRSSDNPHEPVVVTVKTGIVYGDIVFELPLENEIRCNSIEMPERMCDSFVEDLEDGMSRLGMTIEMVYAATGKPVRKCREAKGIPAGVVSVSRKRTQAGGAF